MIASPQARPAVNLHRNAFQSGGIAMGFFGKLLGRQDATPVVPVNARPIPAAAPRQIGYDAKLIDSLLHDHAELGRIFAASAKRRKPAISRKSARC
ncbi:MAG: hypothetical protein ACREPH_13465 [Rhodanobacteraceae bacterium]